MGNYTYPNGATVQQTPYRAWGYIILKTAFSDGSHIVADWPQNRQWWNLLTKGSMVNMTTDASSTPSNYALPDATPGCQDGPDHFATHYGTGLYDIVGDTHLWCIADDQNNGYMPPVEKWFLANGETSSIPNGTRLFFCEGSISIGGAVKNQPTRIDVVNGDVSVTANEDSYGIRFL